MPARKMTLEREALSSVLCRCGSGGSDQSRHYETSVLSVHVGAKKPGFSYRETFLAAEKHLRANLLCLWSLKNPVSDPPLNGYLGVA